MRVLLLLFLALLLPVRGVMASALLCPPPASVPGPTQAPAEAATAERHAHGSCGGHTRADAPSPTAEWQQHAPVNPDTCKLCAACCSAPPMANAELDIPLPQGPAALAFPSRLVPVPGFLPDSRERPPRSL